VQEIHNKLKTLQYRGAKNFSWEKFTNSLLEYYEELKTLHSRVGRWQQIRSMVGMIQHDRTRQIAAEITTDGRLRKKSLREILAKIGERVSIYMQVIGAHSQDDSGGPKVQRQLKKARRRIKALQKKTGSGASGEGGKEKGNYIPKDVLDAVRPAGGADGNKYVKYLLQG
jgi:hypothetical protein